MSVGHARRADGARIKRARRGREVFDESLGRARSMSQLDLAAALRVSRATVSKWERGEALPSGDEVYEFLEIEPPTHGNGDDSERDDDTLADSDGRRLDALPDAVLIARAQELQAQASRLLSILAGRIGAQSRSVPPPTAGDHPRLRRIPLDAEDRPGDRTSG